MCACGGGATDDYGDITSALETALAENQDWPYEAVGVLDIVEAGGFDESGYVEWAVGTLLTEDDDEWGVMIEIKDGIAQRARIDIDSGENVRVWLGAPSREYGVLSYPVVRMEKL